MIGAEEIAIATIPDSRFPNPDSLFKNHDSLFKNESRLPDPAGGNACFAGFFLDVRNRLGVMGDFLANTIEFGERFLAVAADLVALDWVVSGREISRQRVDPALQRFGERLCATEGVPFLGEALAPLLLVLLGRVCRGGCRRLCSCRRFLGLAGAGVGAAVGAAGAASGLRLSPVYTLPPEVTALRRASSCLATSPSDWAAAIPVRT